MFYRSGAERRLCFDLSAAEYEAVAAVGTASVAVHLTLRLGYFKAKQQFFDYGQEAVLEDLRHVLKEHFPGRDPASINTPSRPADALSRRVTGFYRRWSAGGGGKRAQADYPIARASADAGGQGTA